MLRIFSEETFPCHRFFAGLAGLALCFFFRSLHAGRAKVFERSEAFQQVALFFGQFIRRCDLDANEFIALTGMR